MAALIRGLGYTGITLGAGLSYYYITDTRSSIHQYIVPPLFRLVFSDAEVAHERGTQALKQLSIFRLEPRERGDLDDGLGLSVFGHQLSNPFGTSAGIDKNAEIPDQLLEIGPAVVEVGGVVPHPQTGNPKPRVFRIPSQNALINRYGLNSEGADFVAMRLRQRVRDFAFRHGYGIGQDAEDFVLNGGAGVPPGSLVPGKLLAVQVAKNKTTPDQDIAAVTNDYVSCVEKLAPYADIITVNVSSPNTPGLRSLQSVGPLTEILTGVVAATKAAPRKVKPVVMVKVSPDEDSDDEVRGICDAVNFSGVDGIIVGNTTKKRPDPLPAGYILSKKEADALIEQGGYSGPQLFDRTLNLVKKYRRTLDQGGAAASGSGAGANKKAVEGSGKVIFATGGITNGRQAKEILDAGASVAMVYTAVVYGGVGTITRMKEELRTEKGLKPL